MRPHISIYKVVIPIMIVCIALRTLALAHRCRLGGTSIRKASDALVCTQDSPPMIHQWARSMLCGVSLRSCLGGAAGVCAGSARPRESSESILIGDVEALCQAELCHDRLEDDLLSGVHHTVSLDDPAEVVSQHHRACLVGTERLFERWSALLDRLQKPRLAPLSTHGARHALWPLKQKRRF